MRILNPKDLGRVVRETRLSQGLRQPDLAAAAGTSIRFIVELEKGKPTIQLGKALHVLRMLGLQLEVASREAS
jgi:HTH-type transcriptional regulator/antitoxin HipB